MKIDALGIGLSGLRAAQQRLNSSSHNVANLLTEDFHPERTVASEVAEGGVTTRVERSPEPREVDLASELVEQNLASVHAKASMRVIDTSLDLLGSLLDIKR